MKREVFASTLMAALLSGGSRANAANGPASVKTYKFFMTQNQIVLVNPQKQIADIIK